MDKETCKNCTHFLQHYILKDGRLSSVYCGHCSYCRPKSKKPDAPACKNYAPGTSDEEEFVTKEYLTKKLLDQFLHLELLPEIPDALQP